MYESNKLKLNFNEIKIMRESVDNLLISLTDKIETLNIIYKDLITNNINESQTGLDSLHFQSKLINYEIENNYEIFNMIDNHMYCNYYKLYKNIFKYLEETIQNKNIISAFLNKQYPVYKDLDTTTKYDFETIIDIYNTIIQILDVLNNEYLTREHKLNMENNRKKTGLNIDNLVNSLEFNNNNMKNNINLYVQNLLIFNSFHSKYLTRFSLRAKLFYGQINNDIKLGESKSDLNHKITEDDISLEIEEEESIRNFIGSCSNRKEFLDSQTKELNKIISGINISPQISISNSQTMIDMSNNFKEDISYNSHQDMSINTYNEEIYYHLQDYLKNCENNTIIYRNNETITDISGIDNIVYYIKPENNKKCNIS